MTKNKMKEKVYARAKKAAKVQKEIYEVFDILYEEITGKKANIAHLTREGMLIAARRQLAEEGASLASGRIYDIEYVYQDAKTAKGELETIEHLFQEIFGESLMEYHDEYVVTKRQPV